MSHVLLERRPEDYIAGVNSPLEYQELLPLGEWYPYLPTPETQRTVDDKANCVTQAHHNVTEGNFHLALEQGRIPREHIAWLKAKGYFDANGRIDFSEKFNAILNFTTREGNYLWRVADEARVHGLIPERMLLSNLQEDWNTFYNPKQITIEMLALGQEFLERFGLPYEWVEVNVQNIIRHLKHTSLIAVIPGHAVMEVRQIASLWNYFDSYAPYIKERVGVPQVAMKILLQIKQLEMKRVIKLQNSDDQYLVESGKKMKIPDSATHEFLRDQLRIITGMVDVVERAEFDSLVTGRPMPSVAADMANQAIYRFYKERLPLLQDAYDSQ